MIEGSGKLHSSYKTTITLMRKIYKRKKIDLLHIVLPCDALVQKPTAILKRIANVQASLC